MGIGRKVIPENEKFSECVFRNWLICTTNVCIYCAATYSFEISTF